MAHVFNSNHIIYYHMDAQWSMGLAWKYFVNPDYSTVQCWVQAIYLSTDAINQTEPHTYHNTKAF